MSSLAELQTAVKCLNADMKEVEKELRRVPFWESSLLIKQTNASYRWDEVCYCYKGLRDLTQHEKAKVEFIASGELQTRYKELDAWVERAINDHNQDEEAQKRDAKMEEPKKPVAKKVVKDLASGTSTSKTKPQKKNLLREAIKSAMKPSDAEEGKKLCEKPPVDKGQGDPSVLIKVNEELCIEYECYDDIYCGCG